MANLSGTVYRSVAGALSAPGQFAPWAMAQPAPFTPAQAAQAIAGGPGEAIAGGLGLTSPEPCLALGVDQVSAMFGSACLFEKIIVSPRSKACGFVAADVTWQTNVWNTHRAAFATLLRCDVADSGNVRVDNPLGYPLGFGPLQGQDFLTIVPGSGDATIKALLTFVFPGESGADLAITGSRIIVFAADADWSEAPRERTQYLTDIQAAYSTKEQRRALRSVPRTQFTYRALATTALESAALDALLFGCQGRIFGVPFWPDAQPILQNVDQGAATIYADTRYRKFAAGGMAVLWRDLFNSEAVTVQSVAAGSITTTAPINASWPADGRTYLVPMLPGRLADTQVRRMNNQIAEAELTFQLEVC